MLGGCLRIGKEIKCLDRREPNVQFCCNLRDMRVNKANFRMNLALGGASQPHKLTSDQLKMCRNVIKRARFPYAHLDLMVLEEGRCYLSEIALNGGIKGAQIERKVLDNLKIKLLEETAQAIIKGN